MFAVPPWFFFSFRSYAPTIIVVGFAKILWTEQKCDVFLVDPTWWSARRTYRRWMHLFTQLDVRPSLVRRLSGARLDAAKKKSSHRIMHDDGLPLFFTCAKCSNNVLTVLRVVANQTIQTTNEKRNPVHMLMALLLLTTLSSTLNRNTTAAATTRSFHRHLFTINPLLLTSSSTYITNSNSRTTTIVRRKPIRCFVS